MYLYCPFILFQDGKNTQCISKLQVAENVECHVHSKFVYCVQNSSAGGVCVGIFPTEEVEIDQISGMIRLDESSFMREKKAFKDPITMEQKLSVTNLR